MNVAQIGDIIERREYLCRIVAVTSFLGKQRISFRGQEEAESSGNQGNFLELMKLLEKFDTSNHPQMLPPSVLPHKMR